MEDDSNTKDRLPDHLDEEATQSIDLSGLFTQELTASGSFDIRGEIWKTTFGKVIQALPIPALLIDQNLTVTIVNQACGRISDTYERAVGNRFPELVPHPASRQKVQDAADRVFVTRKPRILHATLQICQDSIYGRLTFRSIRIVHERFLLILVEDLSAARREVLLKEEHNKQLTREIERRKRAEEEHAQSEKRYREVVEKASEIIYQTDAKGFFTLVNPSACRLTGFTEQELLGRHYLEVISPDYQDRATRFYGIQFVKESPTTYWELPIITKNGEWVWIGQNVQLLREEGKAVGFQAIARDITQRKQFEDDLQQSKETIEALLNATTDFAVLLDTEGNVLCANKQLAEQLGVTLDELTGKNVFDYLNPEFVEPRRARLNEAVASGQPMRIEEEGMGGRIYDTSIYPAFNRGGGAQGVAVFARDITETKQLQEQLLQVSKMQALGTLAGGMAHDFNNLLQVVVGYADLLLLDKDTGHPDHGRLRAVRDAARKGRDLVQRILTFSRKADFSPRPYDLNHSVEHGRSLMYRTLPKTINIRTELAAKPLTISADPAQIEQVLLNMAFNAKDAMPEGGVLTLRTSRLISKRASLPGLPVLKGNDWALLEVSDTGHGMDRETLSHIFEPFFTTKSSGTGTGLGLAMVYGIVQSHGGHITCTSEPGTGTTFHLYFPTIPDTPEFDGEISCEMPAFGSETVLLVDDEEAVAAVGADILARAGYKVLTASSAIEALELYTRHMNEIELVILDLMMPEMSGIECLEALKGIDPDAAVLIASGFRDNGITKHKIAGAAAGFIAKPFEAKELLQTIRRILDKSEK